MIRRLFRRAPNWYDEASAFVDGELAPDREAAFSRELAASAQLQHYVDELRATKTALAALPELEVPRPFTISVAQAQRSPAMTRRERAERTAPRAAGLLEGTLLMRGAATFSALAIAALAAVVVVDVTQNDGDSQIFRDSAAVGQVAGNAADDQDATRGETAVAAQQSADQSAQAQTQAAALAAPPREEQAETQAALAVAEPESAELEYEAEAAADTEVQTLTEAADTEDEAASDQAAEPAAGDEGDPAIAAAAGSDDAAQEPPADAEAPLEAEAEAGTDTTESTSAPTAELTAEAEAAGTPIEQGSSGGQAEEADIVRATAQSEDAAPPTIEPAPESLSPDEAPDGATDDATAEASDAAADGTTAETTDAATASTAQATTEAAGGDESERATSDNNADNEAESEAPKPGNTTPGATNRTEQAGEQALSEAASGPPEQTPTAALRDDTSEVVQTLEIVLGIAAGLSILTLLVTLYRRRA